MRHDQGLQSSPDTCLSNAGRAWRPVCLGPTPPALHLWCLRHFWSLLLRAGEEAMDGDELCRPAGAEQACDRSHSGTCFTHQLTAALVLLGPPCGWRVGHQGSPSVFANGCGKDGGTAAATETASTAALAGQGFLSELFPQSISRLILNKCLVISFWPKERYPVLAYHVCVSMETAGQTESAVQGGRVITGQHRMNRGASNRKPRLLEELAFSIDQYKKL
ncbi:uncharacterized protein LOC118626244 [Molossus molossus]|uniref:uncharacterized protein LOC118626244 n=1 Tax=Molossus molossus TaxID=27622 RepID=UPI0017461358|nr:uncharacterized protein LOC118626244 [Molossus molossus]